MADRRYNREQKSRVVTSGEAPPDGSGWLLPVLAPAIPIAGIANLLPEGQIRRGLGNTLAALPRAATDALSLVGMAPGLIRAGLSSEVDAGEGVYGEEAVAKAQAFAQSEVERLSSQLPEARRTPNNLKAIQDAVQGSDAVHNILVEGANPVTRAGQVAGDAINDAVGLGPVHKETSVDDAEQILASALMPSSGAAKVAEGAAKTGIRRGLKLASDFIDPRTANFTAKGVAANAGVQEGINQGFRAYTDQPSVLTGDALAADQGVNPAYAADPDIEQGMGVEQMMAAGAGVLGSLSVAAAVMSGKANRAIAKTATETVDRVGINTPEEKAEFEPVLSKASRAKSSTFDQSSALREGVAEAHDQQNAFIRSTELDTKIAELERVVHETAQVNLNTAVGNALDMGLIPGLKEKTVPVSTMRKLLATLPEPEQKLFADASIAGTLLDRHALKLKTAEEELLDAKLGIKNSGGKAKYNAQAKAVDAMKADTAPLPNEMSVKQARELVEAAKANPKVTQLQAMYRKVVADIPKAKLYDGQITQKDADMLTAAHPNYIPLQEKHEDKWWSRLRKDAAGHSPSTLFKQNRAPIRNAGGEGKLEVTNPKHPLDSLSDYVRDHVEYTRRNEATRTYVNSIKGTKDFGRSIKHVESMSIEDFQNLKSAEKIANRDDVFAFTEGGKIHFYKASDPEVMRGLKFNAPATALGLNLLRKLKQQFITGTARPIFAFTSMMYDHGALKNMTKPGRVYGPIQIALNGVTPNSKIVQSIIDYTADPLSKINMYAGLGKTLSMSAIKKAADNIADGLISNSGMAAWIAKAPGGREVLQRAGEAMLRSYNDSAYALFIEHGVKHSNYNADFVSEAKPRYDIAKSMFDSKSYLGKEMKGAREFFHDYMGMLDQVQNAPKYAFFAQNLAVLERKYGSRAKIPESELNRLVHDTKTSSGDMTRSPGNPLMSKIASSVPYGHIMINSTYHVASGFKHDPVRIGSKILTGSVLPKLTGIAAIAALGGPELSNWYWDQLPSWERIGKTPVIGPDWFIDAASGKQRPLTENDVYLVPDAPEFIAITNSVVAALRSLGAFGEKGAQNASFAKDFGEGLEALTGIATPSFVSVPLGGAQLDPGKFATGMLTGKSAVQTPYAESPHQGAAGDKINTDSMFSHSFANMITALTGTAVNQVINSIDVGVQSLENGDSAYEAMSRAFSYEMYQNERSMPETPGTREGGAYLYTSGQRRRYASTQQRERVLQVMDSFDPIVKQLSMDKDKRHTGQEAAERGYQAAPEIQDPVAQKLAQEMYSSLQKGKMFSLTKARSDQVRLLARLDASKDTMSPTVYHLEYNSIMDQMNEINAQQEDIINTLDVTLQHEYGVDIEGAIDAIKGAITR